MCSLVWFVRLSLLTRLFKSCGHIKFIIIVVVVVVVVIY